jgi:hypothetical protein
MQVHPPSRFVDLDAIFLSLCVKDFNLGSGGKIMQPRRQTAGKSAEGKRKTKVKGISSVQPPAGIA